MKNFTFLMITTIGISLTFWSMAQAGGTCSKGDNCENKPTSTIAPIKPPQQTPNRPLTPINRTSEDTHDENGVLQKTTTRVNGKIHRVTHFDPDGKIIKKVQHTGRTRIESTVNPDGSITDVIK